MSSYRMRNSCPRSSATIRRAKDAFPSSSIGFHFPPEEQNNYISSHGRYVNPASFQNFQPIDRDNNRLKKAWKGLVSCMRPLSCMPCAREEPVLKNYLEEKEEMDSEYDLRNLPFFTLVKEYLAIEEKQKSKLSNSKQRLRYEVDLCDNNPPQKKRTGERRSKPRSIPTEETSLRKERRKQEKEMKKGLEEKREAEKERRERKERIEKAAARRRKERERREKKESEVDEESESKHVEIHQSLRRMEKKLIRQEKRRSKVPVEWLGLTDGSRSKKKLSGHNKKECSMPQDPNSSRSAWEWSRDPVLTSNTEVSYTPVEPLKVFEHGEFEERLIATIKTGIKLVIAKQMCYSQGRKYKKSYASKHSSRDYYHTRLNIDIPSNVLKCSERMQLHDFLKTCDKCKMGALKGWSMLWDYNAWFYPNIPGST